MPLVKCPDCEKMVSHRVDICPFCGCPAKFFIKEGLSQDSNKEILVKSEEDRLAGVTSEPKAVDVEKISFSFGKYSISYQAKGATYAALFGVYLQAADVGYEQMIDYYKKAGTIGKALEVLPDKANEFIFGLINKCTEYLYSQGVYITQEEFFKKYDRTYTMDYDRYYSVTLESYSQILDMKKEMRAYREAIKASRGRWQGGGFGVKGAIKGAMTASALNMGSDFLNSFGDSSRERKDNEVIRQKLRELYKNSEGQLCHSVKTCIINVYKAMCEELIKINFFDEIILLQPDKAKTIYENTKKYETDTDAIKLNMIKCITLYPGERKYYEVFRNEFMNGDTDIKDFLAFWHLEYLLSDIIEKRDKQDEFALFMISKGIERFNFSDLTAENTVVLWSWLNEYGKEIPDDGEWAENVSQYLEQFRDNRKEYQKEILIDYHPMDLKYRDFYLICRKNENWLHTKSLSVFDSYVSSGGEGITKFLESDGDYVQLYCNTSIVEIGVKGLAITSKYVVDLKSRNRIKISDIKELEVVEVGNYKYELRFSDKIQEIRFYCEEIREYESAAHYLKNYLKAIFVRYGNNKHLTVLQSDRQEQSVVEENLLDKEEAEEYWKYIQKYKNDTGNAVNVEFSNAFRKKFKTIFKGGSSLWELDKKDIINQYDYKISDNTILQRVGGNAYGQYILISTNSFTLTDQNIYIGGATYDLTTICEIILFSNLHLEENGWIYISMHETGQVISYKRISDLRYLDKIVYMIDVALESLQTEDFKIHYDMKPLFFCEQCGSIDVKQGLVSWTCNRCGNKKMGKISQCVPEDRDISYFRGAVNGLHLTSEEEKQILADEILHSSWIEYILQGKNAEK